MTRISYWYALSGFISLAYQVAWFRIVTDWHGSTNFTFALVVANFIGGLAVGSLLSPRVTRFLSRRLGSTSGLRIYGAVELLVAFSILLTAVGGQLPADLFGGFPYHAQNGVFEHHLGYRALQTVVAAACVFVPCLFMGVSFPLLCDTFRSAAGSARFPARLYAWNTLGACSGVLACQFVLLPWIGHGPMIWWMAALNGLLGLYFVSARFGPEWGAGDVSARARARHPLAPDDASRAPTATYGHLLLLVSLGGFLSGALEGDLFKRITFVLYLNPGATMTLISFWAILAIFLASVTVGRLRGLRVAHIKIAFLVAALYGFVAWYYVDDLQDLVEATVMPIPVAVERTLEGFRNLQFPSGLTQLLVFTGVLVFPPYYLVSLLLPHACNELQRQNRHLGTAYGLNTLAFCLGLLGFVLIAPMVNVFYSLKLFLGVFAVCAAWMLILRESRPLVAWKPAVLAAMLVLVAWRVPREFDRSFFREGTPPAIFPVRAVKSNGANTTFVVDVSGSLRLYFGRLQMSATNLRAQTYMRLMAHFPLLLDPDPKRALLICFGVGNTASAIAAHEGIERIDVVDLDEKVFETAPEFAAVNERVYLDPRMRFIHDDGRNFLHRTDETYDLVTSEPPPPLAAGVYRLYSREYYEEVLAHLTPAGHMSQWLPVFLMTPESVEMAVGTFASVFPHVFLFAGYGTDFVLVGGREPLDVDLLEARFDAAPRVASDLARFNINSPMKLLARIVQGDAALRRGYGTARTISDQHNDLEHAFPDPLERPVVSLVPSEVVAFVEKAAGRPLPELAGILHHLGRLRYHVQGYPFETLATVPASPEVALSDVDWLAAGALSLKNQDALQREGPEGSRRVLEEMLALSDEQPEVLILLARMQAEQGRYAEAIPLLERFLAIERDDVAGRWSLASAYARAGRAEDALAAYRELARRMPHAYAPLQRMAWIHATHPDSPIRDPIRAVALSKQAEEVAGEALPPIRETLAASYAAAGRFEEASEIVESLLATTSPDRRAARRRFHEQLARYRNGEALTEP